MRVVLRYLKPFTAVVAACILLLAGQAVCDLSLPNLMSDIVNVGLQKSGIAEVSPKAISRQGAELISLFMDSDGRAFFEGCYTLAEPGSSLARDNEKKYPAAGSTGVFILTQTDAEAIERLDDIYGSASYAFMLFIREYASDGNAYSPETGVADVDISAVYPMLERLSAMPQSVFLEASQKAGNVDSSLTNQIGTTFTQLFYKELGVDIGKLQQNYILQKGLIMLLVALAGVIAAVGVGYLASRTAAAVSRELRHDVFAKVESFSSGEFDKFSTASLITRTTNDVQQVQMLLTMGIRMLCYAPIMGIGGIIMAVGKSVSMSWIIGVAVIVLIGFIMVMFSVVMPKFKLMQKQLDKLNLVSREQLNGIMVIRAFGNQQYEEDRFDAASRSLNSTQRFTQRSMAFMMPFMTILMNLVSLSIIWFGGHAIAESAMQIGDMMAFMQYSMQIIMSFLMISMMFIMVPRASVSAIRIAEVLNTEPLIKDPEKPKHLAAGRGKGEVKFSHVSFRYHNAEKDVISDLSFTARAGETTAFIGSTGSGKSTVINLIPRFYDITSGSITVDGCDIRDVPLEELRGAIGYIPQQGMLFSGDIRSNIQYGKENASDEEILAAIEVAQASEFINKAEGGIDMAIAQGGGNVSGGQRQRLAIARALIRKPLVYIFDDSFSALDFKTDAALRRALKAHTGDATVLIVAQRISTIMHAEQIIVLNEGKIAGKGTHEELMASCPEYKEIADSQLQLSGGGKEAGMEGGALNE